MAKAKAIPYDTGGFAGVHQARGLDRSAREFLESKGAISRAAEDPKGRTSPKKAKKAKETKPPDTGPKGQAEIEGELPRRTRRARSLKARHFRLPLEIDAKLQDLVDYYDGTMVWVICKLIQDEWVRTRRTLRRERPTAQPDSDTPGDTPAASQAGDRAAARSVETA